jgi:hypothetical protein
MVSPISCYKHRSSGCAEVGASPVPACLDQRKIVVSEGNMGFTKHLMLKYVKYAIVLTYGK